MTRDFSDFLHIILHFLNRNISKVFKNDVVVNKLYLSFSERIKITLNKNYINSR